MEGFKKFLMQGNVIELAVAVVIGTAFAAIIAAFTEAIIDPLIAMAFDADDLADATVGPFKIGLLLAAIINFLIVAAVVYFALIFPMAKLKEVNDRRKGIQPDEPVETDVDILHDIRELLRAQQAPGPAAPGSTPRL
ncbi:large conductance mechanosensitive channel protein MscL [Agrococcus carbonis]|uniref:Large conductance mechanosensitive channel n=1 Tax=Agrococcus carbonis TaxID=684552 RepID=A0A1H1RDF0_9MICO|nr:large conductance mechanosensitive channel protein MscL [Agrococcus carbonis]SDS33708.1 large conductance mechanosensitive channel [Agrococcus carbonis]